MLKNKSLPLILVVAAVWWGQTILADFIVVRSVFAHVQNFFEAGDLGVSLFTSFNKLEVVLATVMVVIVLLQTKKSRALIIAALLSWIIVMVYFSWLNPKIAYLTEVWKNSELKGIPLPYGMTDIQQEHQFYHNLYIGLDSIKIFLLTLIVGICMWKQEKLQ